MTAVGQRHTDCRRARRTELVVTTRVLPEGYYVADLLTLARLQTQPKLINNAFLKCTRTLLKLIASIHAAGYRVTFVTLSAGL
jgi:hypothetical protein